MKKTLQTIVLIASIAFVTSCSSKKANQDPAPAAPGVIPATQTGTGTTTSCGSSSTSGNTVCFSVVSFQELGYYVATHPLNDPTNLQLAVQLADSGNGRYSGTVTVSYTDNGRQYAGVFHADSGTNSDILGANGYNGWQKSEFNHWFTYQGRTVFSGFYQDDYGAIVLVIENVLNTGDGSGGGYLTGSVWYKNFAQSMATYNDTGRHCWFLSAGPYNCQSTTVMNKSDLNPSDGYRKLGTFSGLSKSAAFGN